LIAVTFYVAVPTLPELQAVGVYHPLEQVGCRMLLCFIVTNIYFICMC